MIYLQLFFTFFKIGIFGFGGGYAMLSLAQHEVVDQQQWISLQEFADIVAISQMTPGPISINLATYIGYTTAGYIGTLLATFSLCLPSIIIMFFIIRFFFTHMNNIYIQSVLKYLKPAVAGLILTAALLLMNKDNFTDFGVDDNNYSIIICAVSFIAIYFFKLNPIILIVVSGLVGWLIY